MRAVAVAIALAGVVVADEAKVVVEVRDGPPVEGTPFGTSPLKVDTSYGALVIPAGDLLSLEPGTGVVLAQAGAAKGALDWTEIAVRTRFGDARLPLKDIVRVRWKRDREPPREKHRVELADGTNLSGTVGPEKFGFETAYGTLRIPMTALRLMAREGDDYKLRLADMSVRGKPRVDVWKIDTAYGTLLAPCGDIVLLASRPLPFEGDRLDDGYFVRAVDMLGSSVYALVMRDQPMTLPQAADLAKRMGGHLATVGDADENEILRLLSLRGGAGLQPWIGFSDEGHEGSWRWATGERVDFTNWSRGEPNNSGGRENACELLGTGYWNDVDGGAGRFGCLVEFDG